jgi:hypothetical protein
MSKSVKIISKKSGSQIKSNKIIDTKSQIKSNKIIDTKTGKQVIVDTDVMHHCGYFDLKDKTKNERIKILNEVLKTMIPLKVFKILNYLAIVNKHHEQMHKIFLEDRDYISTKLHSSIKKNIVTSVKAPTVSLKAPTVSLKAPTVSVKEPTRSIKLSKSVKSSKSIKAPTVSVSKEQIKTIITNYQNRYKNKYN